MIYKIEIVRAAQKQILALPRAAQMEIIKAIDSLVNNPRPTGCKKLHGTAFWRLRARHYRAIYAIDDKMHLVTILKVAIRREDTLI